MAGLTIRIDVVSSEENLFSGDASFVVIPTESGEIGVYPRHEPLLSKVRPGVLRITPASGGEEILMAVSGGVVEILPDCITVLSDIAIRSAEFDIEAAKKARDDAEKAASNKDTDYHGTASAEARLAAAIAQLKAVEYIRGKEKSGR